MKERDLFFKRWMRIVVTTAGVVTAFFSVIILIFSNYNFGTLMQLLVGIVMALWFNLPSTRPIKVIKTAILIGFVLLFAVIGYIIIRMSCTKTTYDEDVVIVLGCAVVGERPSNTLVNRLEKCLEYCRKNPKAVVIVSGGQGPQEDISEAEAMKRYLVKNGIDEGRIYKEDKSTSTDENFKFSKVILDDMFPDGCSVCYITNDFHSYRAGCYARKNGIEAVSCNAKTNFTAIVPSYLREAAAVVHYWVIKS
jgi:uncharacterized SAM-binding protein YcdF (DUF218 family)